jgi:formylglycine-generating enzyme required for sulfatase activity
MHVLAAVLALSVAGPAAAQSARTAGTIYRDCDDCPEMVVLPAGSFVMGTPGARAATGVAAAEREATPVRIARPVAIGRFEVTRAEYQRFINDTGYEPPNGCIGWDDARQRFALDLRRSWQNPARPVTPEPTHPASCVSWRDASAYVQWLARRTARPYRLPSEAEWEYAARAGTATAAPWGDSIADGCAYANLYDATTASQYPLGWLAAACSDGAPDVATVGGRAANAWGVFDLLGNVAEWVDDCAGGSYVGRPKDGRAWTWLGGCRERVLRGGSWASDPTRAASAARDAADDRMRSDSVGFRVAVDIDERAARGEAR